MPTTIVDSYNVFSTAFPQQIRVFRNPRGQKYYYALVTRTLSFELYKSQDGVTWTLVSVLIESTVIGTLDIYDDGTQLIVYVTYGGMSGTWTAPIYYRRLRIPDGTSNPIIGVQRTVVPSATQGVPVIKRDRNGYVHIAFMLGRTVTIKGTSYTYAEPRIIGTTTPNPNDAPSWSAVATIDTHPDVAYDSSYARITFVVFGGTGDIGGVVYNSRTSTGVIILKGRDIVSFNGTSYTLGTVTTIISSGVSTDAYNSVAFRAVVDIGQYAHLLTERTLTNARIQSLKASVSNTVESWASPVTVDNTNNLATLYRVSLSVDRTVTPNKLYAFYMFDTVGYNILRYRSSPVDVISWSTESTVVDDTERLERVNASYERTLNSIPVIYTIAVTARTVRFYELVLVVTVDKSAEETYVVTEEYISPYNILISKIREEIYPLIEEGVPLNILIQKFVDDVFPITEESLKEILIPIIPQYNIHLPKQYIKMWVLVKRNGEIVHYCTPYTPFRPERAVQT